MWRTSSAFLADESFTPVAGHQVFGDNTDFIDFAFDPISIVSSPFTTFVQKQLEYIGSSTLIGSPGSPISVTLVQYPTTIPEPSTSAIAGGLLALGFVFWCRRRAG